ncbi:hypothetical protein [Streptomyces beigongshangae]|nr:hypothetical protein [Streptomyces sp. REN17]
MESYETFARGASTPGMPTWLLIIIAVAGIALVTGTLMRKRNGGGS